MTPSIEYSPAELTDRAVHRRAVEAVNWGLPIVNFDAMAQALIRDAEGEFNQIVYWSHFPDWKNQTLTPNGDVIYIMPFTDTREVGPMVLEIPPADEGSITGTMMDAWQNALEDVGPAGVDGGQGGKYLVLPPDFQDQTPEGFIPLPCDTNLGYGLLRSIPENSTDAGLTKAVDYARRIKLYPLSQASDPPATTFNDAVDLVFDATIPYDLRFFEGLDRMVQAEPWLTRDKVMIDMFKSIGIEKGKAFDPSAKNRKILAAALEEAHAWLDLRYETDFPVYYTGKQWFLPASSDLMDGMGTFFSNPDAYPIDDRGVVYSMAFFSSKHAGKGTYYLLAIRDGNGKQLSGASTYRLSVPADAPVSQYWSATVYSRSTHAFVRDVGWPSRSSLTENIQVNADGSTDVYLASAAPPGKETNWTPTKVGEDFEVLFRFYGPEEPVFDKSWQLPDIERLD